MRSVTFKFFSGVPKFISDWIENMLHRSRISYRTFSTVWPRAYTNFRRCQWQKTIFFKNEPTLRTHSSMPFELRAQNSEWWIFNSKSTTSISLVEECFKNANFIVFLLLFFLKTIALASFRLYFSLIFKKTAPTKFNFFFKKQLSSLGLKI